MLIALEGNVFDTIAGVPVHALVVPFAAVLLPIGALALFIEVLAPKLANRLGWFTIVLLALGAGASWVAGESGQALAARLGEPQPHATLGRVLPFVAATLVVAAIVWLILQQRSFKTLGHRSSAASAFAVVTVLLALALGGAAGYTAYLGIQASWAQRITPPVTSSASPSPAPTASSAAPVQSQSPSASAGAYTMAEVSQHADQASCWIVVKGQVYDITPWLSDTSPRRAEVIAVCGGDANTVFDDSMTAPMQRGELSLYLLGPLR